MTVGSGRQRSSAWSSWYSPPASHNRSSLPVISKDKRVTRTTQKPATRHKEHESKGSPEAREGCRASNDRDIARSGNKWTWTRFLSLFSVVVCIACIVIFGYEYLLTQGRLEGTNTLTLSVQHLGDSLNVILADPTRNSGSYLEQQIKAVRPNVTMAQQATYVFTQKHNRLAECFVSESWLTRDCIDIADTFEHTIGALTDQQQHLTDVKERLEDAMIAKINATIQASMAPQDHSRWDEDMWGAPVNLGKVMFRPLDSPESPLRSVQDWINNEPAGTVVPAIKRSYLDSILRSVKHLLDKEPAGIVVHALWEYPVTYHNNGEINTSALRVAIQTTKSALYVYKSLQGLLNGSTCHLSGEGRYVCEKATQRIIGDQIRALADRLNNGSTPFISADRLRTVLRRIMSRLASYVS